MLIDAYDTFTAFFNFARARYCMKFYMYWLVLVSVKCSNLLFIYLYTSQLNICYLKIKYGSFTIQSRHHVTRVDDKVIKKTGTDNATLNFNHKCKRHKGHNSTCVREVVMNLLAL
jgi:hypothetical protein